MASEPIRLLVVEDHGATRQALVRLLGDEPDLSVVGQAADGQGALKLIRATEPDVVLLDVRMPRFDGVVTAQILRYEFPHIIIVGMSAGPNDAAAMCRIGVATCVPKGDLRALRAAIRQSRHRRPVA